MKTVVLIIVAIILFSCNKSEFEMPLNMKDNSNKGIKVLTESRYSVISANGEIVKGDLLSKSVLKYNEAGDLLESLKYGNNGFKNSNQLSLLSNVIYKYDSKGNLIEMLSKIRGIMTPSKWVYKNNKYGYQVEMNAYFDDGSIAYKSTSKHDDKGNMVERNWTEGDATSKQVCIYDAKNNMIEMNEYYNGSKSSSLKTTFKYDDKGNKTEYMAVNASSHFYTRQNYEYDNKGNQITLMNYDSSGNVLSIANFKYFDFDVFDHWRRQEYYNNGVITWVAEREIEYY